MSEASQEQQKSILVIRSPLSEDGFVAIYFSSPDGRLMNQQEWSHLRDVVDLANKVCIKQQARSQTA
ncbi:MAG: hypothetical protein ABSA57_06780 [Candidatus Acidiferrales bacterium]|jgi:hypothetical protein